MAHAIKGNSEFERMKNLAGMTETEYAALERQLEKESARNTRLKNMGYAVKYALTTAGISFGSYGVLGLYKQNMEFVQQTFCQPAIFIQTFCAVTAGLALGSMTTKPIVMKIPSPPAQKKKKVLAQSTAFGRAAFATLLTLNMMMTGQNYSDETKKWDRERAKTEKSKVDETGNLLPPSKFISFKQKREDDSIRNRYGWTVNVDSIRRLGPPTPKQP